MNTKLLGTLLCGIVAYGVLLATPAHAVRFVDPIAAGNAACPDQPYYRYSGGNPDSFTAPEDTAYPSQNLVDFMTNQVPNTIVAYDAASDNVRFGDSFNLQDFRSVCYAVLVFRARHSGDIPGNDSLNLGHVGPGGTPFFIAVQIINPGITSAQQSYVFSAAELTLLSNNITGANTPGWTPLESVLDIYMQDDTEMDFIQLYVWYGPNCLETNPANCI